MADPYGVGTADAVWSDPMNVEMRRRLYEQAVRDGADPNDFPSVDSPAEGELPALDGSSDWAPQSPLGVAAAAPTAGAQPSQGGLDALLDRRRKSVSEMYDAAAQQLQAAYRGPSTSDLLLALGAGMLQPTRGGGFGEAVGNSLQSMLPFLQERNKFRNTVAEKVAGLNMQKARDLGDLEEKYLVAQMKRPPQRRVTADALGNRFNTATGFDVPTPDRIDFLLQNGRDPYVVTAFNKQFGPGAAEEYMAEYGGR